MKKYINQQDMKDQNLSNVLALIRKHGSLTRRQIESLTGLSWGSVSKVTSTLLDLEYIKEMKFEENSGPGRTPIYLEINGNEHFSVGVDINISGFCAVLLNMKNEVIHTITKKESFNTKNELLKQITDIIYEILSFAEGHHILSIGIAMQGLVDSAKGISVHFPTCKDWNNVPLAKLLETEFEIPVFIEHDPECILYTHSELEQAEDVILIRIDKGIGMAAIMDGKIFHRFGAFELGKVKVNQNETLSMYASQHGLKNLYGDSFEILVSDARKKNAQATALFDKMAKYLAFSVFNTAELLNISKIMLCGEMFDYSELFLDAFYREISNLKSDGSLKFSIADVKNAATGAAMIGINRTTLNF